MWPGLGAERFRSRRYVLYTKWMQYNWSAHHDAGRRHSLSAVSRPHCCLFGIVIPLCLSVDVFIAIANRTLRTSFILIIKPTRSTNFSNLFSEKKPYMFRTVLLSIIRSFSLYTQQWYMLYRFADSLQRRVRMEFRLDPARKLYEIYHCCVCSEKLLMIDGGTVRNM